MLFKAKSNKARAAKLPIFADLFKAVGRYARQLMQMPLDKDGNKYTGPNAAPTFELKRDKLYLGFSLKKKELKILRKNKWNYKVFHDIRLKQMKEFFSTNNRRYQAHLHHNKTETATSKKKPKQYHALAEEDRVLEPLTENPLLDVSEAYLYPSDEL